ncbi:hypothetical protein PHYSODRAFT_293820 [Phytophthora sojae]|uniref:BRCT domain-containing protein n=1 Tax=Phytophthora sojae (strain P6497) TaxID=1094619 RepID=G4YMA3_PHYSP|nr:hypothetical protein PHYSODRAFT_293820 [Phytophthora sojae]EGZ28233.1 hypothetical protein PHYSODRAFT_293820 [Phytophthora sojae]|eukprot:XP_009515508.1 hypothetical protein PHYSODRAFT_293820 [Phytophthora sojae]
MGAQAKCPPVCYVLQICSNTGRCRYYLAKLVQEHGGSVASALTATRVTHMVGSNLNGSKADKVVKSSGKVKFVSPEWILKSVKQKKRQPEHEYLVYKDARAASSLQTAFSRTAPPKQ